MRCPKCGFISFDDLSACSKCTNDLADLAEELQGTGTGTDVGFFLGSVIKSTSYESEEDMGTQSFPPMEAQELNFDDSPSEISFDLEDHDDSVISLSGMSADGDDDISLELGEVLPIDLTQFDETGPATSRMSAHELSFELGDDADFDLSDTSQLRISETLDLSDNLEQIEPSSFNLLDEDLDVEDHLSSVDLDDIDLSDLLPEQEEITPEQKSEELELSVNAGALDLDTLDEGEHGEELALEDEDEVVDLSSLIEESGEDEINLDDDLDLSLLSDEADESLPEIQLETELVADDDTIPDIQLMGGNDDEMPEIELMDEDSEEPPEIPNRG
ncbi:MAG: hypothetical protein KKB30_11095 [Proteobacteria bacterium]|nr:hypothetical protein [Pseudomonadota bacterium]MBU1714313.1 hypothetical protein [Pseudomonadota bacterium]